MSEPSAPLQRLAAHCGIVTEYEGTDGKTHRAGYDTICAVLAALGIEARSGDEARDFLRAYRAEADQQTLAPVVVSRSRERTVIPINIPAGLDPEKAAVVLELETGEMRSAPLEKLLGQVIPSSTAGGEHRLLAFARAGWCDLDPGLHILRVETPHWSQDAQLVAAPRCPLPDRQWGAFMPLHAMRGNSDWGIGSYSDLGEFAQWIEELGGGFVGTLPLYPIDDLPPIDPSPYLPLSRLAYNELFLDLLAVPECCQSERARRMVESPQFRRQQEQLRSGHLVDYDAVSSLKIRVLTLMFDELVNENAKRLSDLQTFGDEHPELRAYAEYRARREVGRRSEDLPLDPNFYLYTQWLAAEQLDRAGTLGAPLYTDMPVGVRPDGFDVDWAPQSFAKGVHGGAPPDSFFSGGQNWGFRPMHPEAVRQDGYGYLRACLRRACQAARFLRLDHVAGLHRLYWVPEGMSATEGAYVRYHGEEIRALVCLEAWRSATVVVGEDLGTVQPAVRSAMDADGMLRSWVLQFESSESHPLPHPPSHSMASLSTHDLPRFVTFLGDHVEEERPENGSERVRWRNALNATLKLPESEPADKVMIRCLERLAQGPADLLLLDVEEVWGQREAQNRPGTGPEENNWRRRADHTLKEMRTDHTKNAFLQSLTELRQVQVTSAAP